MHGALSTSRRARLPRSTEIVWAGRYARRWQTPPLTRSSWWQTLEAASWSVAIVLAAGQLWARRFDIHSDGLSYIEIAEAWAAGDWRDAVNPVWSPLYSWLLALAPALATPAFEAQAVKLVNLAVFIAALAAFRSLLHAACAWHEQSASGAGVPALPRSVLVPAGYALFTWASLRLAPVALVSPDLLLTVFIYLLAARLLRQRLQPAAAAGGGFGALLGLGYLTKTALLAAAPAFVAAAVLPANEPARARQRAVRILVLFAVVAAPWVLVLSIGRGELTVGSAGTWNMARFAGGIAIPVHWQGEPPGSGMPLHPTRRLLSSPALFEFGDPVSGVYPPWRDPAYWYEGARARFLPAGPRVVIKGLRRLGGILVEPPYLITFALLLLAATAAGLRRLVPSLRRLWFLWLPPLTALVSYLLIYLEPRYVAGHITVLALAALAAASGSETVWRRRLVLLLAASLWLPLAPDFMSTLHSAGGIARRVATGAPFPPNPSVELAEHLRAHGIDAGDLIGYVGSGYRFYWARLAGVRIVAEIRQFDPEGETTSWALSPADARTRDAFRPHVDLFWEGWPGRQTRALERFARAGVRALVTDHPRGLTAVGWQPLGDTGWAVYDLAPPHATAP